MQISPGEKLIAFMLADLIEHLGVESELDPKFVKDVLAGDDAWALNWKYNGLFHDEGPSKEIIDETASIMSMCRVLENSIGNLSPADKATIPAHEQKVFVGFDGNQEQHYGVAETLVNKLDRFEEWKDRSMNSHTRSIDRYRRMKAEYDRISSPMSGFFSLDDIQRILAA